ncbi:unnamed protein product [Protopolystoma xenopodis]|uniref:Uncharacterized protein n=1 Tax=Protopolystoma xenopodis TaxID=117903 RepID=A0A3S5B632_9PLAT|nr:unnamed protein product [Protopolystoma xenopodis]
MTGLFACIHPNSPTVHEVERKLDRNEAPLHPPQSLHNFWARKRVPQTSGTCNLGPRTDLILTCRHDIRPLRCVGTWSSGEMQPTVCRGLGGVCSRAVKKRAK